jgi:hypothetical protein
VAAFSILFVLLQMLSWYDYRLEECDLTDKFVFVGFRQRPTFVNALRWHETYLMVGIAASMAIVWGYAEWFMLPRML